MYSSFVLLNPSIELRETMTRRTALFNGNSRKKMGNNDNNNNNNNNNNNDNHNKDIYTNNNNANKNSSGKYISYDESKMTITTTAKKTKQY